MYKDGEYKQVVMRNKCNVYVAYRRKQSRHLAGSWTDNNLAQHGFVEIDGHFTSVDFPGASANGNTAVSGINDRDEIVGFYNGAIALEIDPCADSLLHR